MKFNIQASKQRFRGTEINFSKHEQFLVKFTQQKHMNDLTRFKDSVDKYSVEVACLARVYLLKTIHENSVYLSSIEKLIYQCRDVEKTIHRSH